MEMSSRYEEPQPPRASKLPIVTVVARVVTLVSLVISLALTKSNEPTYKEDGFYFLLTYKIHRSYQYGLFTIVVGLAYTAIQAPFAVYYAIKRKRLINHYGLLRFDFYADKVISYILATATGATFGVTTDFKRSIDSTGPSSYRSTYDEFYNLAFVSAGFLFIGFLSSAVSSIISSRALSKE